MARIVINSDITICGGDHQYPCQIDIAKTNQGCITIIHKDLQSVIDALNAVKKDCIVTLGKRAIEV